MQSSGDIRPLYFYGNPTDEQRRMLREAKEAMGVPWFVRLTPAKPDIEGNVIAFEPLPFWVDGGIALLRPPYTTARMLAALNEVLGVIEPKHLYYQEWPGAEAVKEILGAVEIEGPRVESEE